MKKKSGIILDIGNYREKDTQLHLNFKRHRSTIAFMKDAFAVSGVEPTYPILLVHPEMKKELDNLFLTGILKTEENTDEKSYEDSAAAAVNSSDAPGTFHYDYVQGGNIYN
jgi:hypothetical protein